MVIFLTGLVSMILMRTLRNDYAKYARENDDMETQVKLFLPISQVFTWTHVQWHILVRELLIGGVRLVEFLYRKGMYLKSLVGSLSMVTFSDLHKIWLSFQRLLGLVLSLQHLFSLSFYLPTLERCTWGTFATRAANWLYRSFSIWILTTTWLRRGAIITTFVVCYALTSFISGYVSGGLYSRNAGMCSSPWCLISCFLMHHSRLS